MVKVLSPVTATVTVTLLCPLALRAEKFSDVLKKIVTRERTSQN